MTVDIIGTAILFFILGTGLGNHQGDQATLKDCAIKGIAKMSGGGSITCAVVREQP